MMSKACFQVVALWFLLSLLLTEVSGAVVWSDTPGNLVKKIAGADVSSLASTSQVNLFIFLSRCFDYLNTVLL